MPESWIEEQCRKSFRLRWYLRIMMLRYRFIERPYLWLKNELVWDFEKYPEGRLMHFRTKEFLEEDDPRHYEDFEQ